MNGNSKPIESVKILYKYLPQKYALKVIKEKRLKLSDMLMLNDFFDCRPKYLHSDFERIVEDKNCLYKLLCLSAVDRNPLLWGHYADSSRGLALGFSVEALNPFMGLKQVIYDNTYDHTRQVVDWDNHQHERCQSGDYNLEEVQALIEKIYFCKSRKWVYESEYRGVYRVSELEYDNKGRSYVIFPSEALREIVVGIHSNYNDQKRANSFACRLKKEFPRQDIVIKFLKEHESEYRFEIDASRTIHTNPCCGD